MSRRKTHKEFIQQIQDRLAEYEVLSRYEQATKKIRFKHKECGSEFEMKPMHFVYGEGCPFCRGKRIARTKTKTLSEFIEKLPAKYDGWTFKNFSGSTAPVDAVCPECGREHHYYSAKSFVSGLAGCRTCANRMSPEKLKKELLTLGYDLIAREPARLTCTGKNRISELYVRCRKCGTERKAAIGNLRAAPCLTCSGHYAGTSDEEGEIFEWFKSLAPDAVQSDRSLLKMLGKRGGQQVDIYSPSKKVAIEYNGRYWHSIQHLTRPDPKTGLPRMLYAEAKKYHYLKSFWCEKAGVRLIHIWDYEWEDERKRKVLKNIILGALGMLPERYFARNTTVHHYERTDPRWKELCQFFADNNIQGDRGGSHVFTLEDNNRRILMAYKFGRPSGGRAKKLYEYEMVRGASAPGVQVVGGASKLWRHFVDTLHPNSVVYYIDYNYFDGRSVEKLGGKFIASQPGVKNYWIDEQRVKNREPARHKEVRQAIEDGKCLELWNAGTKTYVFSY